MAALRQPSPTPNDTDSHPSSALDGSYLAPVPAFRKAGRAYPHKVTLDLDDEQYRALRLATVDDGVPVSERLRGLIADWIRQTHP